MDRLQDMPSRMRRYLLGGLDEAEAAAIDAECLANQDARLDFWEAEAVLIDDYVHGRLSPTDRQGFERHYMSTLRNQEHVALIAGLAGARRRLAAVPRVRAVPVWRIAAAAVLAVGIGLGSWQVWNSRQSERNNLQQTRRELADARSTLLLAQAKLAASEANQKAVFTLDSVDRGGAGVSIAVPAGATEMTLVVPRDSGVPDPKSATLYRVGASTRERVGLCRVYVPQLLSYALVYVDAQLLRPGSYQVELEGQRSVAFKIPEK